MQNSIAEFTVFSMDFEGRFGFSLGVFLETFWHRFLYSFLIRKNGAGGAKMLTGSGRPGEMRGPGLEDLGGSST